MKIAAILLAIVGALTYLNFINNPDMYVQNGIDCRDIKKSPMCSINGGRYVSVMQDRTDGHLDELFSCDCTTGKVVNFDEP